MDVIGEVAKLLLLTYSYRCFRSQKDSTAKRVLQTHHCFGQSANPRIRTH